MSTIIISDIHLGNRLNKVSELIDILQGRFPSFKRLVINGDLISDHNLNRLTKKEWKFLGLLRKWANNGVEVVWIEGNHDYGFAEILSHLLGITVCTEYEWNWNGKTCLAIHGHQFDEIACGKFAKFISWIYLEITKSEWIRKHFGIELSEWSSKWQRISGKVRDEAIKLAKHRKIDFIFCGHTHDKMQYENEDVTYFNSGCWVEKTMTLIVQDRDATELINF
jgi:UDP-2,3-diacylglucosamine pyrophosphatase LpxH